jgi:GT2 family glycosyltransferase
MTELTAFQPVGDDAVGGGSITVVVATRSRPEDVRTLLLSLAKSSSMPEQAIIVGVDAGDWQGVERLVLPFPVVTLVSPEPGLPRQRNVAVAHLLAGNRNGRKDVVAFFDDDFVPHSRWIEQVLMVLRDQTIVGVTGTVLRDGAKTEAVPTGDAVRLVEQWSGGNGGLVGVSSLYGCNMAVRASVFLQARFDERLPLYGWLEDLDFSGAIARQGRLVRAANCVGVHRGAKAARVSGRRYGYSQVANPLYLAYKGTCPIPKAGLFVARALASNLLRSTRQHPVFDYRGRLRGNLRAIVDLVRGQMRPERILES